MPRYDPLLFFYHHHHHHHYYYYCFLYSFRHLLIVSFLYLFSIIITIYYPWFYSLHSRAPSFDFTQRLHIMKHHRILLAALLPATTAILCPAGSQCAANCGNVLAATSPDDLVCDERAFKIDPTGQLFAGCVECQKSSTYHSGNDSDIQAMLCRFFSLFFSLLTSL